MEIKRCSDCGRFLGVNSFNWSDKKRGYRRGYCKRCNSNRYYLWELDNKEHRKKYTEQYRKENKEHIKEYNKNNTEHRNEFTKQWTKNNRDKVNSTQARRKAKKLEQTPELTNHELKKIDLYYQISNYLGDDWHVDHIIPLSRGGLHHPNNLQVITKEDNLKKGSSLNYEVSCSFRI